MCPPLYHENEMSDGSAKTRRLDPMAAALPSVTREGDWIILKFSDGRCVFGQCLKHKRGKHAPVKVYKRSYSTHNLIGLPYGTVLEVGKNQLVPLPEGEDLMPKLASAEDIEQQQEASLSQSADNRHLVDNNKSQSMKQEDLVKLRREGTDGLKIIQSLIENSSTFDSKTDFSKAKYIARKQMKYQQRCRMIRCSARAICELQYWKESRKIMNLRQDTLGQILSYANVTAGAQVLVFETVMCLITGALAQRMGGYGRILSVYTGQQPAYIDLLERFNLSFPEHHSIKWVHSEDIFCDVPCDDDDPEAADRDALQWPCPLQDHTREYLKSMTDEKEVTAFMDKRCNRFARKLTRNSPVETKQMLTSRQSDSLIIATRYDPVKTLKRMWPFLASSGPFVVFSEYQEPLAECFQELQEKKMAINLRLSDTWMREYQVLPGRTHPNMHMSQNGGFLLVGIKTDPVTGVNEIDEEVRKQIREKIGGRRGKRPNKNKAKENGQREPKRHRVAGTE